MSRDQGGGTTCSGCTANALNTKCDKTEGKQKQEWNSRSSKHVHTEQCSLEGKKGIRMTWSSAATGMVEALRRLRSRNGQPRARAWRPASASTETEWMLSEGKSESKTGTKP